MNDQIWLLKEDDWEWHTVGFLFSEEKAKRWANRAEKGEPQRAAVSVPHYELKQNQDV